jgi:hypothetical protein
MKLRLSHLVFVLPLVAALAAPAVVRSQAPATPSSQSRIFTTADYDNAAQFLGAGLNNLVVGGVVNVTWLPDERFWCRTTRADRRTILVSPVARTRVVCTPSDCRAR